MLVHKYGKLVCGAGRFLTIGWASAHRPLYVPDFTTRNFRGRVSPMRVSVMSPCLSVDRNAVAPIGKPMALSHSPRRTSIGTSTRARSMVTFAVKTGRFASWVRPR